MKLYDFKKRNNLDIPEYQLSVNYGNQKISDNEFICFSEFLVYHSIDTRKRSFLVVGKYINKKQIKDFELCVEQINDKDYNTSHISSVFFNNRKTIIMFIQAYFNNTITPQKEKETITEKVEINSDLEESDTFILDSVKKEITVEKTEEIEPTIFIQKPKVVKPKPKKKPVAKRKTTK